MGCGASAVAANEAAQPAKDFHATYSLDQMIGSGGYGVVYKAHHRCEGFKDHALAVKILPKKSLKGESASVVKKRFDSEVEMLTRCQSRNVIELIHVFENRQFCYALMEHGHCTVLQALVDSQQATELDIARILAGMAEGVGYCHKMKVVHRDVKPQNFLLAEGTDITDQRCVVKLSDFGMAKIMPDGFDCLTELCGTCPFVAPEMLQNEGYNYKVDIWSLGVTAYLMFFGVFPYNPASQDRSDLRNMIRNGETPISFRTENDSEQPSEEAVAFLKKLLDREPRSRPTAASVLLLPYVKPHRETRQTARSCSNGLQSHIVRTDHLARLFDGMEDEEDSKMSEKSQARKKLQEDLQKLVQQADGRHGSLQRTMTPPDAEKRREQRSLTKASNISDASTEISMSDSVAVSEFTACERQEIEIM
jgi:serine/threonine protein kinase